MILERFWVRVHLSLLQFRLVGSKSSHPPVIDGNVTSAPEVIGPRTAVLLVGVTILF